MNRGRGRSEPAAWIVRFAPLVPEGAVVLDLACGAGRHTRLFLAHGHAVTAVDVDVSGLDDLRRQPQLEIVQADLEKAPWPLPGRRFGAVVVTNYLWRPLFEPMLQAIEEGGVLLYETFAHGNEAYRRPTNPDFLLGPGELIEAVRGRLQIVAYEHGYVERPRPAVKQRLCAARTERPLPLWPTSSMSGEWRPASRNGGGAGDSPSSPAEARSNGVHAPDAKTRERDEDATPAARHDGTPHRRRR